MLILHSSSYIFQLVGWLYENTCWLWYKSYLKWSLCVWCYSSTTMQYVILTYMKHLGVRVKEPRSLESKRVRINFLPKIKVLVWPTVAILAPTSNKQFSVAVWLGLDNKTTWLGLGRKPILAERLLAESTEGKLLPCACSPCRVSSCYSNLKLTLLIHPFSPIIFNHMQKSIKTEKEGEEKVKKPRFPSILGPQRRPSRVEAASGEI